MRFGDREGCSKVGFALFFGLILGLSCASPTPRDMNPVGSLMTAYLMGYAFIATATLVVDS